VHSVQILELLQRYSVLSISNETEVQFHLSQATMNNAVKQIHKEMHVSVLIPHTADKSSDLTELNTMDREVLEEEEVTEEEEEEEGEKEGNEEDMVSNNDTEHSIIMVAPRCPGRSRS